MKIRKVEATRVDVPIAVTVLGLDKKTSMSVCLVEIETDEGHTGWGLTSITSPTVVAAAVNSECAPVLIGEDPMDTEKLWDKLYWTLSPRGQTGFGLHAIAAIDLALWDIKGKALGEPVWRLLGGARSRVPLYATFGFPIFDRDQIGEAAKLWVENGFTRLKMTVGDGALKRRDEPRFIPDVIAEDLERVRRVRTAVGDEIGLYVDGNCNLDPFHAKEIAKGMEEFDISFFEEPITQNDALQMADLRRHTSIPLACGQNEGLAFRFRDLLIAGSVDVVQPNVAITGGFTQCVKIAGMAQAFNVGIDNGGAWQFHNMHLHAGLANGGMVEMHYLAHELYKTLYTGLPEPDNGWLDLPAEPGLGFEPKRDVIRELGVK